MTNDFLLLLLLYITRNYCPLKDRNSKEYKTLLSVICPGHCVHEDGKPAATQYYAVKRNGLSTQPEEPLGTNLRPVVSVLCLAFGEVPVPIVRSAALDLTLLRPS